MADLLTTRYENNKLYRHSGFSATISASLAITSAMGVVWKDPDVYFGVNGATSTKKGTGFSSTVASSIALDVVAMDFAGSDLLSVYDSTKMKKHSGFSATIATSFTSAEYLRGIAWDGTNVMNSAFLEKKIRKFSGFTNTVTDSFTMSGYTKDISWDGTNVIITHANARYCLMSGFSSTVTSSFGIEAGGADPYGLDWDGYPSTGSSSSIKTVNGLALASVKTVNGLAIASVKTVKGLA